jgi:hypothetical protein
MPNEQRSLRIFSIAASTAMSIWLVIITYWQDIDLPTLTPVIAGIVIFLINGLLRPLSYQMLQQRWLAVAHVINRGVSKILLSGTYLLVILPSAAIYRLCGKHINSAPHLSNTSYLIKSAPILPQDMEQPF